MKKLLLFVLVGSLLAVGCNQPTTNTNVNVNTSLDKNANANLSNANLGNLSNTTSSMIETNEPDIYQAKVSLNFEAMGDQQNMKLPTPLVALVARNGADRRIEFTMPNGQKIVYLEKAGTNYGILPAQKQFAELDKEALGVEVQSLMMPDQLIDRIEQLKGIQKVGEEQVNGRTVVRYNYESVTDTKSQAGNVQTESYILVDKETGLPLRTETLSESQGGQVQGFKGIRIITEMSDIQTTVSPELFDAPPADYKKIDSQQVRNQLNLITQAAMAIMGQMMRQSQTTASPTVSPTVQQ
jgi:hypothetical protein